MLAINIARPEPCLSRYSEDAPPLSFAGGADPGRAFLPKRVAVRTSWRGAPKQCRLAMASPLETNTKRICVAGKGAGKHQSRRSSTQTLQKSR